MNRPKTVEEMTRSLRYFRALDWLSQFGQGLLIGYLVSRDFDNGWPAITLVLNCVLFGFTLHGKVTNARSRKALLHNARLFESFQAAATAHMQSEASKAQLKTQALFAQQAFKEVLAQAIARRERTDWIHARIEGLGKAIREAQFQDWPLKAERGETVVIKGLN